MEAFSGFYDVEELSPKGPLVMICNRCGNSINTKEQQHYHCLGCNDGSYDICFACAKKGIYCQDDTHSWVRRIVKDDEILEISGKTRPEFARALRVLPSTCDYPSTFQPPQATDKPDSLFVDEHRFIRSTDPREILIYTDGSCLRNGQSNPQAGCAFVYRPSAYSQTGVLTHGGTICFSLEARGPTGIWHKHTSNRAELRAVIAALQFRDWSMDCNRSWRSLVIATDSEYVAVNATERIQLWEMDGWMLASQQGRDRAAVKNQDLWKLFLKLVRQLQGAGVNVALWRIPRNCNERADNFAKLAAEKEGPSYFQIVEYASSTSYRLEPYQNNAGL